MQCFIFLLICVYRLLLCRLKKKVIFCEEHCPREKPSFCKESRLQGGPVCSDLFKWVRGPQRLKSGVEPRQRISDPGLERESEGAQGPEGRAARRDYL